VKEKLNQRKDLLLITDIQDQKKDGKPILVWVQDNYLMRKVIQSIKNFIGLREVEIKEVEKGEIAVPFFRGKVEPSNSMYKIRQSEYLSKLGYEIKSAEKEIERLQKRYDEWSLK